MSDLTFTKVADLPIVHIQNFYSPDELEKIMNESIHNENYELASKIRDEINLSLIHI